MKENYKLMLGDNIESLKKLKDNSVDSVVTDPPYGLKFMSKKWDYDVPSVEFWEEVYRVLKPGGHILSFGGSRTFHRMAVNIEDGGFDIRDTITWLYGSGFPKGHNIGKKIDELGIENNFDGFGTALKPAVEFISLARKPLSEKTIVKNVLKHGTGGLNIDGSRIGYKNEEDEKSSIPGSLNNKNPNEFFVGLIKGGQHNNTGRFPANLILECTCTEIIKGEEGEVTSRTFNKGIFGRGSSDFTGEEYNDKGNIHTDPNCPCYMLDKQSGISKSTKGNRITYTDRISDSGWKETNRKPNDSAGFTDKGGASRYFKNIEGDRFFYSPKVSKRERNLGMGGFEDKVSELNGGGLGRKVTIEKRLNDNKGYAPMNKNIHATVKPVKLMSYLCKLITPPNGVILDPFMGSGSTGIAALLNDFKFIGMEMEEEYLEIAEQRIKNYKLYK